MLYVSAKPGGDVSMQPTAAAHLHVEFHFKRAAQVGHDQTAVGAQLVIQGTSWKRGRKGLPEQLLSICQTGSNAVTHAVPVLLPHALQQELLPLACHII